MTRQIRNTSKNASSSADCGVKTGILKEPLQPLKYTSYDHTFLSCDKDKVEISAIRRVDSAVGIQRELSCR